MIYKKKDNISIIASALVLVLFFVFFGSFSRKAYKPIGNYHQYELAQSNHNSAFESAQNIVFQQSDIASFEIVKFLISSSVQNTFLTKQLIKHQLVSLQKKAILIRPSIKQQLFYQHQYFDSETPPILS
jgi:hypothetical protein